MGPITRENSDTDTAEECEGGSTENESEDEEKSQDKGQSSQQQHKSKPVDFREEQLQYRLSLLNVGDQESPSADLGTAEGCGGGDVEACGDGEREEEAFQGGAETAKAEADDQAGFVLLRRNVLPSPGTTNIDSSEDSSSERANTGGFRLTDTASVQSSIHPELIKRRAKSQIQKKLAKQKAQRTRKRGEAAIVTKKRRENMNDIKTSVSGFWFD